jgi:hypothetical protein
MEAAYFTAEEMQANVDQDRAERRELRGRVQSALAKLEEVQRELEDLETELTDG